MKNYQKNSLKKELKKPWEEQFSAHSLETVSERGAEHSLNIVLQQGSVNGC